jgi:hypothetical protein
MLPRKKIKKRSSGWVEPEKSFRLLLPERLFLFMLRILPP